MHPPSPLQTRPLCTPSWQLVGPHGVPDSAKRHPRIPLQTPPHVDPSSPEQSPSGSRPSGVAPHRPGRPAISHRSQAPSQALSQHLPSTQYRLSHSSPAEQSAPSGSPVVDTDASVSPPSASTSSSGRHVAVAAQSASPPEQPARRPSRPPRTTNQNLGTIGLMAARNSLGNSGGRRSFVPLHGTGRHLWWVEQTAKPSDLRGELRRIGGSLGPLMRLAVSAFPPGAPWPSYRRRGHGRYASARTRRACARPCSR